ncbi:hypothetical protein [Brevundimonas sp. SORGH_AS_0993]|uniref:hypothetical protein n=1 Tax=Brevundimonas sp. SORGH_AS_0993 TaxID=3041794 RepID=UPI002782E0A4|nr:hypothetical protein [Brevundimonas sp. SORGH_AS_0993]MDQ1154815.1 hypothetical protein [Brevundimonas sp. SORGH_AS_0993]
MDIATQMLDELVDQTERLVRSGIFLPERRDAASLTLRLLTAPSWAALVLHYRTFDPAYDPKVVLRELRALVCVAVLGGPGNYSQPEYDAAWAMLHEDMTLVSGLVQRRMDGENVPYFPSLVATQFWDQRLTLVGRDFEPQEVVLASQAVGAAMLAVLKRANA